MYYNRIGSGLPILFIHPPLLTGDNFAYQQAQLADTFQVITFDIRGHGQSGYSEQPVTHRLIADDVCKLMDKLNIPKAYLCGYSTGGAIALEALLACPERFLGGILISAMSEVSDWYNRSRVWTAARLTRWKGKRVMCAAIAMGNADSIRMFKRLYESALHGHVRNMHQYYESTSRYNCTSRLHNIHAPMLLVYGKKDTSFHRYARLLHSRLPNGTLHLIPGAHHQIPTKNARALHELIRLWLADSIAKPNAAAATVTDEAEPARDPAGQAVMRDPAEADTADLWRDATD